MAGVWKGETRGRLALRELEALAGAGLAGLLALFLARVARLFRLCFVDLQELFLQSHRRLGMVVAVFEVQIEEFGQDLAPIS